METATIDNFVRSERYAHSPATRAPAGREFIDCGDCELDDLALLLRIRVDGGTYEAELANRFADDPAWSVRAERLVSLGLARWLPSKLGRYLVPKWTPRASQRA